MDRVVILGRGGAGKSTLARRLGEATGAPVTELDAHFWQPGLAPMPPEAWAIAQAELIAQPRWVMDGDLGPYDVVGPRLAAADTIVVLDFGLLRCAAPGGRPAAPASASTSGSGSPGGAGAIDRACCARPAPPTPIWSCSARRARSAPGCAPTARPEVMVCRLTANHCQKFRL